MIINTNMNALNANRMVGVNSTNASKAMAQLSSGLRINSAADDASGLAISEKMKGQINGLNTASSNAQTAVSLTQTADGALTETTSVLQRMRELAVQGSNDTNTTADRTAIQTETTALTAQIDNIATTTQFNTKNLLDGSIGAATTTQGTKLDTGTIENGAGAAPAPATLLTALTDSNGNNLGLQVGDIITINGNKNGSPVAQTSYTVTATSAVSDLTGAGSIGGGTMAISGNGLELTGADGTANGLSNVTIQAANRTLFNNTLAVTQTQAAQDTKTDSSLTMQIGANQGQTMNIAISSMTSSALGVNGLDLTTQAGAENAIKSIDTATALVSNTRSQIGAYQNRLTSTINNLGTTSQNLTAAQSAITDVDMAATMAEFSKDNVESQAAQAMISQANQQPAQVLQLLR